MKHALQFVGGLFGAFVCAATGAYVLRHFETSAGLLGGVGLILLGVAIALPVQLHAGAAALKDNVVLVVPVVVGAIRGGSRKTDPPAEQPPTDAGTPS